VKINAIIETAIYVDDLQATEAFYRTVLGLTVIATEFGHHVFFQVGASSVLLVFIAEATLKGDQLPKARKPLFTIGSHSTRSRSVVEFFTG
jgi:catechol 2,3-dioxygenase-like lactoylglutathione lyase family enzyme